MATSLLDHAGSCINKHDGEVHIGCAGDHVSRVLNVARTVSNDERALWRCKVAISDVNGDSLFALCAQAIGKKRQVHIVVATAFANGFNVLKLVFENALRVVQEATNQR